MNNSHEKRRGQPAMERTGKDRIVGECEASRKGRKRNARPVVYVRPWVGTPAAVEIQDAMNDSSK